ncbi:MAG TPA: class I adenylate-forming enzyme family protein [Ramlibacter sp.]|nr:class I adenylate-forming enzyme family protein [Ramlibacter sp.]
MTTTRIHTLFDEWLAREPARVFIHLPDAQCSFAQLGEWVDQAETELREDGVGSGDRVLIIAENCPQHVALILAVSRVGAWSCGINARMAAGEVDAFAAKADARVCYFTSSVSTAAAAHAERLGARSSRVAGLLRTAARSNAQPEPEPLASSVAAIIFTSGTTGASKGVLMTHDGVTHFGRVSAASRDLGPADRSYACLPMTHIFGLGTVLVASLYAGASLVMRSRFDPADVIDALANHGVSQLQGPPTLFARLVAYMDQHGIQLPPAPNLRYIYAGAGPLDLPLKRRVEAALGLPLHHGYGLSEYAGSVCVTRLDENRDDTAAGHLLEGAEYRISDPVTGQELPDGKRGEIWMRGRGLMPGYFRDAEATRAVMREGGWYASGDIGERGPDGALFVVDRLKEMIIRSGFNVYPGEVEAVLNAFPAVERAAVAGRAEADGNEEVLAFVQLRPGATLDRAALQSHLRANLSPYKQPAHVHVVAEFPMTGNGKVLKRELLALHRHPTETSP